MKLSEIQKLIGEASAHEIDPQKRYLLCVERTTPVEHCVEIQKWLERHEMHVTILPVGDVRLFEIEE